MTPQVLTVSPFEPDAGAIARAAEVIRAGGLVAFPTETVYGLGANALDAAAVARIYAAKGRPATSPVIVHVADAAAARALVTDWPGDAARLAEAFWPGPLTLVLPRRDIVPSIVTAGLDAVAVRVPAHPVALALVRAAGVPIAAPSANRYTQVSPTRAEHAVTSLGDRVDLVLDGGPTEIGIESTVLSLIGPIPLVLRPGMIGHDAIRAVTGDVSVTGTFVVDEAVARASPGLAARHYAPLARVVLYDAADAADGVETLAGGEQGAPEVLRSGGRVGALVITEPPSGAAPVMRLPPNPDAYARGLYDALHRLDAAGCEIVLVERVPQGADWDALRDRLMRAANPI